MEKNATDRLQKRQKQYNKQGKVFKTVREDFVDSINQIHESEEMDDDFKNKYKSATRIQPTRLEDIVYSVEYFLTELQCKTLNPNAYILGYYVLSAEKDSVDVDKIKAVFKEFCPQKSRTENKKKSKYFESYRSVNREDIIRYARFWINLLRNNNP